MNLRGDIGVRIRVLREGAGVTLADLARRLRTHPSNIQRWEQGRVSPNWRSLMRIAQALAVSVEDLVAEAEEEERTGSPEVRLTASSMREEMPAPRTAALYCTMLGSSPSEGPLGMLTRFLRDPRLRPLLEALGDLPDDLTEREARQLGEIIKAYIKARE